MIGFNNVAHIPRLMSLKWYIVAVVIGLSESYRIWIDGTSCDVGIEIVKWIEIKN